MTGHLVVPSYSTVQRLLIDVDKEAFDRIVNDTMHTQVKKRSNTADRAYDGPAPGVPLDPNDLTASATSSAFDDDSDPFDPDPFDPDPSDDEAAPRCLAVDGKSLRVAIRATAASCTCSRSSPTQSGSSSAKKRSTT